MEDNQPNGTVRIGDQELKLHAANPRLHGRRNRDLVAESLRQNRAGRSILIDENNEVIVGNNVATQAAEQGDFDLKIVDIGPNTIVAVRRTDMTEAQKAEMAVADNVVGLEGEWNPQIVAKLGRETLGRYFDVRAVNQFIPLPVPTRPYLGIPSEASTAPDYDPPPPPPPLPPQVNLASQVPDRHPVSIVWNNAEKRAWDDLKRFMQVRSDKEACLLLMKNWKDRLEGLGIDDAALVQMLREAANE